jgi:hypothetical protein
MMGVERSISDEDWDLTLHNLIEPRFLSHRSIFNIARIYVILSK